MRTHGHATLGCQSKARFACPPKLWRRRARILFACLLAASFLFAAVPHGFAQTADPTQNFGLDSEFSQVAIQSDRDLKSVIATIVNITLGFLGIVAVVIIIYAGYLWMTASGNEEQVTRAKSILRNAVIGLVIIMASWAIAAFVINRLGGAFGGGGGDDGGGSGGGLPPGSGGAAAFRVDAVTTSHIPPFPEGSDKEEVTLCSSVQTEFNHYVGVESFEDLKDGAALGVFRTIGGVPVKEGAVRAVRRNNTIAFKNEAAGVRVDWLLNTTYDLRLAKELRDGPGLALSNCADCDSEEADHWRWTFTTGTESDEIPPSLTSAFPSDGESNVPRPVVFSLVFSEPIDAESLSGQGNTLNTDNIKLQRKDPATDAFDPPFSGAMFDANSKKDRIIFWVNTNYTAIDGEQGVLDPYTEYRLIIQNLKDQCGNALDLSGEDDSDGDGVADIDIIFETGADLPGVSFVRPSSGYAYSCPATPAFIQFRTSMYNVRTQSCGVDPNGLAGLVLGGTLAPAGVTLRTLPEDDFTGTGSPMDYCKQYSFNLDPNDAADDLISEIEYAASVDFIKPGGDVANPENHSWSFTVAPVGQCANEPYINYVSTGLGRNQGQWGQCLTVQGRYFDEPLAGAHRAYASLSLASPLNGEASQEVLDEWLGHPGLDLPNFDRAWTGNAIAADFIGEPSEPIPTQTAVENRVDFDVAVSVAYPFLPKPLQSNPVRFTVDTTRTFTGPCLYTINPASGFWGDSVALLGSNLGSGQGSELAFYNQKTALPASWTNTRIQSRVPNQAQNNPADGEVSVTVNGVQSNKLEFNLRAGVGQSCSAVPASCSPDPGLCSAGLECSTSSCTCQVPDTFRITSVQPAASCTDSCASAVISFETSKPIASIAGSRVQLKKCPSGIQCAWLNPESTLVPAMVSLDGAQRAVIAPQTQGNTLDLNAWYLVRVAGGPGGVVATDNKTIANLNADTDTMPGEDSYMWAFKTGSSACGVSRIELPQSSIGLFEGESADLAVRAFGPANSCASGGQEITAPDNFSWQACEYVNGDVSFECRQSCDAPLLGGNAIASVAASSSSRSVITGGEGSADGSVKALACGFYDQGSTHLSDGATATVYAACSTNEDCTRNGQCAGSACLQTGANAGRCSPTITNFSPASGIAGTWVTVNGCYFGNTRQRVDIGADPSGQPAQAVAPSAAWCGATWSDSQIIAEVAPNAINPGPVRVTRPGFDLASFGTYNPDGASHPGICRLAPAQGMPQDAVSIRGQGFGADPGASGSVVFTVDSAPFATTDVVARAARSGCPEDGWENNELCIRVAQAQAGEGTVKVMRDASESNAVSFRVLGAIPPGSGNPNNLAVKSYQPGDGAYACLNMVVEVVLRGKVTAASLGFAPGERLESAGANFYVRRTRDNSPIAGIADALVRGEQTTLRLYPDQGQFSVRVFAPPPDYQIILKGGISGLHSTAGGILATDAVCDELSDSDRVAGLTDQDCIINFDTVNNNQDTQCRVTHFEIEPVAPIFTCARDNCEGDQDEQPGHQRVFEAFPINRAGQSTTARSGFAWSSSNPAILSEIQPTYHDALAFPQKLFDIHPVDGSTSISARANIEGADITGRTEARVFLCENPWPPDMALDGLPFSDATGDDSFTEKNVKTNFSTFYCRDRGTAGTIDDLPEIPKRCFDSGEPNPNLQYSEATCTTDDECALRGEGNRCKYGEFGCSGSDCSDPDPGRSDDRLLKEIFLSVPELNNAIIIQSLTNRENDSVSEWYSRQDYSTSDPESDPQSIAPLDNFEAIQDRRTIYVGALNDTTDFLNGSTPGAPLSIYNNIYRIVVSDRAPADLIQIFTQLVSNWRFLVNIPDDNQKAELRRDAERIKDAHALARLLDRANPAPALTTGSFTKGLSLSVWPSWDETLPLPTDFGVALPHDPAERIQCDANASATDSQTCRTATADPGYACNAETNAYMYVYRNQGGTASFTANLEYAPPGSWNWISGGGWTLAPQACMDNALQYRKP